MNKNVKRLSNFLIIFPLFSLTYIYWPVITQEVDYYTTGPQQFTQPKSTDFSIIIEKIGVNEAVTANVDPFTPGRYLPVLNHSIAHAQGSSLPGEDGNIYLFGHSSDSPFSITRYNTSFYLLDKLKPGDPIILYYHDQPYSYKVREKKVVKPTQVEALTRSDRNQLTLQTCTPVGTSLNRLLVFADPAGM